MQGSYYHLKGINTQKNIATASSCHQVPKGATRRLSLALREAL